MESGGIEYSFALIPRGGVGFFLDPEYAAAAAVRSTPPSATFAGDQYSIAALLYHLLSGRHHPDFSLEKESLLGQILKGSPVPLAARGLPGWLHWIECFCARSAKEASRTDFPMWRAWQWRTTRTCCEPTLLRKTEPDVRISVHRRDMRHRPEKTG